MCASAYGRRLAPRNVAQSSIQRENWHFETHTLGISDQTVKFHVTSITGTLGAANRTEAVRRAVRRGLIVL
jgi:Bacterial regulatory proteins, luxR family